MPFIPIEGSFTPVEEEKEKRGFTSIIPEEEVKEDEIGRPVFDASMGMKRGLEGEPFDPSILKTYEDKIGDKYGLEPKEVANLVIQSKREGISPEQIISKQGLEEPTFDPIAVGVTGGGMVGVQALQKGLGLSQAFLRSGVTALASVPTEVAAELVSMEVPEDWRLLTNIATGIGLGFTSESKLINSIVKKFTKESVEEATSKLVSKTPDIKQTDEVLANPEKVLEKGKILRAEKDIAPGFEQYVSRESTMNKTPWTRQIYRAGRTFADNMGFSRTYYDETIDSMMKDGGFNKLSRKEAEDVFLSLEERIDLSKLTPKALKASEQLAKPVREFQDSLWTGMAQNALKEKGVPVSEILAEESIEGLQGLLTKNEIPMGYLDNYLAHVFQGDYWLEVGGKKLKRYPNEWKALFDAQKLIKEDPSKQVKVIVDSITSPEDVTYLSQRGLWGLISRIKDKVGDKGVEVMTNQDIRESLQGTVATRPRRRFVGNFMKRLSDNPNYEKDLPKVMKYYGYQVSRKLNQDKFTREAERLTSAMMKDSDRYGEMSKYTKEKFIPAVLGHPSGLDKTLSNAAGMLGLDKSVFKKLAGKGQTAQFIWDLGYSASSAFVNSLQSMNTIALAGPKAFGKALRHGAGIKLKGKPVSPWADQKVVDEAIEAIEHEASLLGTSVHHKAKALLLPTGLFKEIELRNRLQSYFSGREYGFEVFDSLKKGGKSAEKALTRLRLVIPDTDPLYETALDIIRKKGGDKNSFATNAAYEMVEKTQFRYGKIAGSPIFDQGFVKLMSPYKSFLINQTKLSYDLLKPYGIFKHPKEAATFAGLYFAAGGLEGNPVLASYGHLADTVMTKLYPEKRNLSEYLEDKGYDSGVVGKLGVDISGQLAVNMPTSPSEMVGRVGTIIGDTFELMKARSRITPGIGDRPLATREKRKVFRNLLPSQGRRIWEASRVAKTGEVIRPITGSLVRKVDDPILEALKVGFGFRGYNESRLLKDEMALQERKENLKKRTGDYRQEFVNSLSEGDIGGALKLVESSLKGVSDSLSMVQRATSPRRRSEAITELQSWMDTYGSTRSTALQNPMMRRFIPEMERKILRGTPQGMKFEAIQKLHGGR